MATKSQRNITSVLVGKTGTFEALATVQITDPTASTYIDDGQIVMLGYNDAVLAPGSTVSDSQYIRFVQRSGATASTAKLKFGPRIRGIDITAVDGTNYAAPAEQVSTLGYNGSAGSLDATASEQMITFVGLWDDTQWSERLYRKTWDHSSTANTQLLMAKNFVNKMNFDQFKALTNGGTGRFFSAVTLADGATQSVLTGTPTLNLANMSDVGTFSNAVATNGVAVGNHFRIGTGVGVAATTSTAVYIVTAIPTTDTSLTANQVRFHTYFQGSTVTTGTEGTDYDRFTGMAAYGIKVTGLPLTWGLPPYSDFKYQKVRFRLETKEFGASTSGTPTNASLGNGTGEMVSEFEYFASGNEGALNRTKLPLPSGWADAAQATTYDTIFIKSADRANVSIMGGVPAMEIESFIFTPYNVAQNSVLLTQINPYINSLGLPSISII